MKLHSEKDKLYKQHWKFISQIKKKFPNLQKINLQIDLKEEIIPELQNFMKKIENQGISIRFHFNHDYFNFDSEKYSLFNEYYEKVRMRFFFQPPKIIDEIGNFSNLKSLHFDLHNLGGDFSKRLSHIIMQIKTLTTLKLYLSLY